MLPYTDRSVRQQHHKCYRWKLKWNEMIFYINKFKQCLFFKLFLLKKKSQRHSLDIDILIDASFVHGLVDS